MMKKERVLYLDLIRTVSFLMVTAYHFIGVVRDCDIIANVESYNAYSNGYLGPAAVLCFFMISGAALTYQYHEECNLKKFYQKRALSIFPIFWLAYLFAFLDFFYWNKAVPVAPKQNFLLTIIGMDGYASYRIPTFYLVGEWFLGAIILLYLLYPLYRTIASRCFFLLPLIFGAGSLWLVYNNPFQMAVNRNLIYCSFFFTFGMMIEQLRLRISPRMSIICKRIFGITGLASICYLMMPNGINHQINQLFVDAIMALSIYFFLMEAADLIRPVQIKKVLATVSSYSFAFFLLHHILLVRYVSHFSGSIMSGTSTLVLFASAVILIYLLAIALTKLEIKLFGNR